MEHDKQNKIDRLIDQFGDVQRLAPNPFLLTRIRQKIENRKARQATEGKFILIFTVVMGIFIGLNVFSFNHFNKEPQNMGSSQDSGAQALVEAYDLKVSEY